MNDYAKHMGKTNMTSLAGKWDVPGSFYSHCTGEKSLITMGISNNFILLADISLEIFDFHLTYLNWTFLFEKLNAFTMWNKVQKEYPNFLFY